MYNDQKDDYIYIVETTGANEHIWVPVAVSLSEREAELRMERFDSKKPARLKKCLISNVGGMVIKKRGGIVL